MQLSKSLMSPVHNSRQFHTLWLELVWLLLASSTSVLVSFHIPAVAGLPHYISDEWAGEFHCTQLCLFLLFCSSILLFLSPLPSQLSPSPLCVLVPLFFPLVRFKGNYLWTGELVNVFQLLLTCQRSLPPSGLVKGRKTGRVLFCLFWHCLQICRSFNSSDVSFPRCLVCLSVLSILTMFVFSLFVKHCFISVVQKV